MTNKWIKRFAALTHTTKLWSKDQSTQVGAVIVDETKRVLSMGYNGIPQGVNDDFDERHERPAKYFFFEHAERNAIFTAGRNGVSLQDSTIFCSMFPCADCARAIIQSGITAVYSSAPDNNRWNESHQAALLMFMEANVKVEYILTDTLDPKEDADSLEEEREVDG